MKSTNLIGGFNPIKLPPYFSSEKRFLNSTGFVLLFILRFSISSENENTIANRMKFWDRSRPVPTYFVLSTPRSSNPKLLLIVKILCNLFVDW